MDKVDQEIHHVLNGKRNRVAPVEINGSTVFLLLNEDRLNCEPTAMVLKHIGDAELSERAMRITKTLDWEEIQ